MPSGRVVVPYSIFSAAKQGPTRKTRRSVLSRMPRGRSASTSASGMGFSIGSYAFKSGTIVSVAAGASYTATFTQTFIANSTTSNGSNAVTFTSGAINLVGWIK